MRPAAWVRWVVVGVIVCGVALEADTGEMCWHFQFTFALRH